MNSYISKESESEKTEIEQLRHDVDSIRRLLQFELAGLMSDTKKREEPVRAMIYELLLSSGFDKSISNELSESIDSDASFNFAWRQLAQNLERRIKTGSDEIVTDGGIVTLIGPAGVGKTTTIAKLAARFVMKYGADRVALITADHYRIGAVEQVRFESQVNALKKQSRLKMKHYLVLPATAQRKVLEHAYEHFSNIGLKGIILTKIDESESLADALSLCIKQKLMLSYVTDGQRVPEDLEVPDARALALKALSSVESDVAKFALDQSVL